MATSGAAQTGPRGHDRWRLAVLLAGAGAVVAAAHWPALRATAITFDDHQYLTHNHLVRAPSWTSTTRFFGEVLKPSTVRGYYQPLTMVSLMLDWARGGRMDHLTPFHLTSLALHVANTVLIGVLLFQLFGHAWVAATVALLFGVHPMTVEPVTWLSERKTLLATLFTLTCLIEYVAWTRRPDWAKYTAVLITFVLALLSKPTSTPVPVLLLLLDAWPLGRLSVVRWRAVLEKLPLFIIATVFAVITVVSQGRTAAMAMPHEYTPWRIPLTLCHNVVFYLYKIVCPFELSSHYAYPQPFDLTQPMVLAGVIGTPILLILLLLSLRRTPALAVGWLLFFLAIFPTLGVIGFTHLIAADKYAYLPSMGLLMILAWLGVNWSDHASLPRRLVLATIVVVLVLAGAFGTRRQLAYWRDTETLYAHMLSVTPDAPTLHSDLGDELLRQRRLDEAVAHFHQALAVNPNWYNAHNGLGMALLESKRPEEALAHFSQATRIRPERGAAYSGCGAALVALGRDREAEAAFREALALDPEIAETHVNMGAIYGRRQDWPRALEHYRVALRLKPELPQVHFNYGIALVQTREYEQAERAFRAAIRLRPTHAPAHGALGLVLALQGRFDESIEAYERALRVAPDDARLKAALEQVRAQKEAGVIPQ